MVVLRPGYARQRSLPKMIAWSVRLSWGPTRGSQGVFALSLVTGNPSAVTFTAVLLMYGTVFLN